MKWAICKSIKLYFIRNAGKSYFLNGSTIMGEGGGGGDGGGGVKCSSLRRKKYFFGDSSEGGVKALFALQLRKLLFFAASLIQRM
jgi:hypothetical protein